MRGTVIQRGKRWSVIIEVGRDPVTGMRDRKWHSGFATKREAERARIELLAAHQTGTYVEPSRLTLGTYLLQQWLPTKRNTVKANTHKTLETYVTRYILPALGSRLIQQLTPALVNQMYVALLDNGRRDGSGLSPKTVRNVHGTLRKALADAEKWGLVQRNVAAFADPPAARPPQLKVWDTDEVRAFLESVLEDRLRALWTLALSTGMRRSELLGLGWDNVDLDAGVLAVADTLVMVGQEPVLRAAEAKTASSRRTIALDAGTVAALRDHRRRQLEERMAAGEIWQESGLVFTREDGAPLHPTWVTRRFKRLVKRADLPWIGLHGCRHTSATLGLKAGIPAKVVSERLGHSSISMTLDRYSHVLANMQRDAASQIGELLFG